MESERHGDDDWAVPSGDEPIKFYDQDLLGRGPIAQAFTEELLKSDIRNGLISAIVGPWGAGKTSLLNLVAIRLHREENVRVLEFNPWLFADAEQLADAFLRELVTQLRDFEQPRVRARRIAASVTDAVAKYSDGLGALTFIPGVDVFKGVVKIAARRATSKLRASESLHGRRAAAIKALDSVEGRIVVLIDDIDRLTPVEVRHLFRILRVTASFPKVLYIICLDRNVVAGQLSEPGFSGRDYLDKALTLTCDVPTLDKGEVRRIFFAETSRLLDESSDVHLKVDNFFAVYDHVVEPLVRTMRDVKRLLTSLPMALSFCGDELTFGDLVGIEAVRLFAPELFALIDSYSVALTSVPPMGGSRSVQDVDLSGFITAGGLAEEVGRSIVSQLFPAGLRHIGGQVFGDGFETSWREDRRIASSHVLGFYLRKRLPPDVATAAQVAEAVESFGNLQMARALFNGLEDQVLEDLLRRLEPYSEKQAGFEVATVATEVLLEQFGRLGTRRSGMFDLGPEFLIVRPVLRFLRNLDEDQIFLLCKRLVLSCPTLFGAFELVTMVGHRKNAGIRLVGEARAAELERDLLARIRATPPEILASESHVNRIIYHGVVGVMEERLAPVLEQLNDERLAAAVLLDAVTESRSGSVGGYTVTHKYELNWQTLNSFYGGSENVGIAIGRVREGVAKGRLEPSERLRQALALADAEAAS